MNLKGLRSAYKMSQQKIADYLNVTQATYSGWETGKFEMDHTNLMMLANYYKVPADYLLDEAFPKMNELLGVLGTDYGVKLIDGAYSIYRDLENGFDVEITVYESMLYRVDIYVWAYEIANGKKAKYQIVERAFNIVKIENIVDRIRDIESRYLSKKREDAVDFLSKNQLQLPSNAIQFDKSDLIPIPIVGRVAAGLSCLADQNVEGYEYILRSEISENERYIFLNVVGDSMYPIFLDGDKVLIQCQTSVDSGSYAVVIVDGEDGVVKKVIYGEDWIELHSVNPMFQVRRFEGKDVLDLAIVGLVKKVVRNL